MFSRYSVFTAAGFAVIATVTVCLWLRMKRDVGEVNPTGRAPVAAHDATRSADGDGVPATQVGRSDPGSGASVVRSTESGNTSARIQHFRAVYSDAVGQLGLEPATSAQIVDLIAERFQSARDALDLARKTKMNAQGRRAVQAAEQAVADQIREVVDAAAYDRIQQIIRDGMFHSQVQLQIRPEMDAAGWPMAPAQAAQLGADLARVWTSPEIDQLRVAVDPGSQLSAGDEKLLERASSYLSFGQAEVLRRCLREHTATLLRTRSQGQQR